MKARGGARPGRRGSEDGDPDRRRGSMWGVPLSGRPSDRQGSAPAVADIRPRAAENTHDAATRCQRHHQTIYIRGVFLSYHGKLVRIRKPSSATSRYACTILIGAYNPFGLSADLFIIIMQRKESRRQISPIICKLRT